MMEKDKIKVGTCVRGFGIKGEVKVRILTDFPLERFKLGNTLHHELNGKWTDLVIETVRYHQDHALLKFEGYPDLTAVEPYIKGDLYVQRDEIDTKDVVLYFQLVDCEVKDESGKLIGTISEVFDTGKHPILRIKTETRDVLVPYVPTFIIKADIKHKSVIIRWMEGL